MSERPNFAGVLAEHRWHHTATTHCTCGFRVPLAQLAVKGYDLHLTAALNAEVDRWLADEGTRQRIALEFDFHLTDRTYESGCVLACGYDGDDMGDHLAAAALAALTTTTEPTAEEQR